MISQFSFAFRGCTGGDTVSDECISYIHTFSRMFFNYFDFLSKLLFLSNHSGTLRDIFVLNDHPAYANTV